MKFYSKPIQEHNEVPLADEGRLEEIISHWKHREAPKKAQDNTINCCYVVSVSHPDDPHPNAKLAEILALVETQGDHICGHESYQLTKPKPKTYLGQGHCDEIAARATRLGADMLVLDAALSPSQMRNLEERTGMPICDREAVILNVFLSHAKTRRARNQVEIAQLQYLRPRIRGLGLNMDQQAGGIMRGRGPGETASELMARHLDKRLTQLQKSSKKLQQADISQRKSRTTCKRIALVGYTNAGKTSLMNGLTSAELSARNRLFETLDTTTRCLARRPSGDILLSDTVGFIRDLPDHLLASFESTLAELVETDLLVFVVDASDPEIALHLSTTEALLVRLKANAIRRFYVFNKIDKLHSSQPQDFANLCHCTDYMLLSSFDTKAIGDLKSRIIKIVNHSYTTINVLVPYTSRQLMAHIYARCEVIESTPTKVGLKFLLEGERAVLEQIETASEVENEKI